MVIEYLVGDRDFSDDNNDLDWGGITPLDLPRIPTDNRKGGLPFRLPLPSSDIYGPHPPRGDTTRDSDEVQRGVIIVDYTVNIGYS